jgi:hypothetical protein
MLLSVIQIFIGLQLYDGAIASKTDDKTLTFHKIKEICGNLKDYNFSALEFSMIFL